MDRVATIYDESQIFSLVVRMLMPMSEVSGYRQRDSLEGVCSYSIGYIEPRGQWSIQLGKFDKQVYTYR